MPFHKCLICCAHLVNLNPGFNCEMNAADHGKILCQLLRLPRGDDLSNRHRLDSFDCGSFVSFEQIFQSASYCQTCDWKVKAVGQILKDIEQLERRLDVHRVEIEEHLQNNLNTENSHPKDDANANQFAWNAVINYIHKKGSKSKDFEPPPPDFDLGLVDPLEINNQGQGQGREQLDLDSGDPDLDLCDSSFFNFDHCSGVEDEDHGEKFGLCQEFEAQELTSNKANNANFSISNHDDPEEKSKIMKSAFPIIRLVRLENITDSESGKVKVKVRQVKIGPNSNSVKVIRKPKPKSKRNTPKRKAKAKDDYPCGHDDVCPARFASLTKWHDHITAEHNGGIPALFLCPFCKTDFGHLVPLRQHVLTVHEPHKIKFKCEEPGCGKVFSTRTNRDDHKDTHERAQRYLCEFCSESFLCSQRLKYHRVSKHAAEANLEPYKCKICAKTFADPRNLREHNRRIHLKIYKFNCPTCGIGVQRKSELEKHKLRFHNEQGRPFMCDKCPATFKLNSDLRKHAQIHVYADKPRPYKCTTCGATFLDKGGLRRHELVVHSKGKKTHVCTICGRAFPIKNYLTNHINYSHKNKRYPSQQSGKGKGGSGSAIQIQNSSTNPQNSNNIVVSNN